MKKQSIEKLFLDDQADRKRLGVLMQWITGRDVIRKKSLAKLLKILTNLTGKDLFQAALIYHHGPSLEDSRIAIELSGESKALGYGKSDELFRAAADRLLIKQGRKQKFNTQRIGPMATKPKLRR